MHPVLCFIKDQGTVAFKDLVGHFHTFNTEAVVNLLANGGIYIVESRQAVHKTTKKQFLIKQLFKQTLFSACFFGQFFQEFLLACGRFFRDFDFYINQQISKAFFAQFRHTATLHL